MKSKPQQNRAKKSNEPYVIIYIQYYARCTVSKIRYLTCLTYVILACEALPNFGAVNVRAAFFYSP